jgi:hypothetical protein
MKPKLAPRLKKVEAPPVIMRTWIVRCYVGDQLASTAYLPTDKAAGELAHRWRCGGNDHYADVEVVTQERRLR